MSNSVGTRVEDDLRAVRPNQRPVWEQIVSFALVSGDTTGSFTFPADLNGILQKVIVTLPDYAVDPQLSITIDDNADNTIFSQGPLAENDTHNFSVNEPISGSIDIGLTFTDPTNSGTMTVTLRGI